MLGPDSCPPIEIVIVKEERYEAIRFTGTNHNELEMFLRERFPGPVTMECTFSKDPWLYPNLEQNKMEVLCLLFGDDQATMIKAGDYLLYVRERGHILTMDERTLKFKFRMATRHSVKELGNG